MPSFAAYSGMLLLIAAYVWIFSGLQQMIFMEWEHLELFKYIISTISL